MRARPTSEKLRPAEISMDESRGLSLAPGADHPERRQHMSDPDMKQTSDPDITYDAIERLEWAERKQEDTPLKRFRQFSRRTALTGSAAAIAAVAIEACGSSKSTSSAAASSGGGGGSGVFGSSNNQHFV